MNRKRLLTILIIAVVVAATGLYAGWFRRDSALQGSGTVEARNIRVGSKVGGRIDKVLVREGDFVQPGQILITFDDKELQAALQQSHANAESAARLSSRGNRRGPCRRCASQS
jgi:multidrug efflux pump subunit AcrA (membrane-fusion protein)